jgi:preprotein translocase subunit Sec61beta
MGISCITFRARFAGRCDIYLRAKEAGMKTPAIFKSRIVQGGAAVCAALIAAAFLMDVPWQLALMPVWIVIACIALTLLLLSDKDIR